jgi:hypothetical protein
MAASVASVAGLIAEYEMILGEMREAASARDALWWDEVTFKLHHEVGLPAEPRR